MKAIRPLLICSAGLLGATLALAQTDSDHASASPLADSGAADTAPATPAPKARTLSPALSQALSASMPRYNPPQAKPAKPATDDDDDSDKPRNGIVRLPRYVIESNRSPVFEEKDIYTKKGLAELASKRYLTEFDRGVLNRYTIPLFGQSAEQRAMTQYYEDERIRKQHEAKDTVAVLQQVDPEAAKSLDNDVNRTFLREDSTTPSSLRQ